MCRDISCTVRCAVLYHATSAELPSCIDYVSPLSNHRTDNYGGFLDNRLRLPLEIAQSMREQWNKPIFYRVSATDWFEGEERCDDQHDKDHAGHGEWRFW